ncbi:diacylglycerol/lipid kinase family protein [Streptococcus orisasini]
MLYILVNPNAGDKKGLKKAIVIQKTYPQFKAKIYLTQCADDEINQLTQILAAYQSDQDQLLIIGGDGTLSKVLLALPKDIPFAYLASGSGNDFNRSLPASLEMVMEALKKRRTQEISVFQSANHLILNSLGFGFDARVISYSQHSSLKRWLNQFGLGKLTYLLLGIRSAFSRKSVSLTIKDAKGHSQKLSDLFLFVLANTAYFGGGITIWPEASVKTNQIDLVYLKKGTVFQNIQGLLALVLKKHQKSSRLKHESYTELTLDCYKPTAAQVDGELTEIVRETFTCQKRKIYL